MSKTVKIPLKKIYKERQRGKKDIFFKEGFLNCFRYEIGYLLY